jgi:hypothetical protein
MGMGAELSLILGVMGTVWTGNPLSLNPGFSIGGTVTGDDSNNILGNLVGLLGMSFLPKLFHSMPSSQSSQVNLVVLGVPITGSNPTHPSRVMTFMSLEMLGQ